MTPNEELAYNVIRKGKAHTMKQVVEYLHMSNTANLSCILDNLVRNGKLDKGNCPTCNKIGYYELP